MRRQRGMTLVELLTVIAMIAILASILFPVFARAREGARAHSCLNNQVNIMLAMQMYAGDHEGLFPPLDDDLEPLTARYLRRPFVFSCPSGRNEVPMGAPANPPKPVVEAISGPATSGQGSVTFTQGPPSGMGGGMGTPMSSPPPVPPDVLKTSYYYRGGHGPSEWPSVPVTSDQELMHADRATVMFSDGHSRRMSADEWREHGFRPISEVWPPPGSNAPGSGMPGMGGMPGGGP